MPLALLGLLALRLLSLGLFGAFSRLGGGLLRSGGVGLFSWLFALGSRVTLSSRVALGSVSGVSWSWRWVLGLLGGYGFDLFLVSRLIGR